MPAGPEPEPTADLVRQIQAGDEDRFTELYSRLSPTLFLWISLKLPRGLQVHVAPEDVLQEIWCRAMAKFASYEPERSPFRSWIFGFAYRVVQEALRAAIRLRRAEAPADSKVFAFTDVPAVATAITQRVAREDTLRQLLACIREMALDSEDQDLLLLRGMEGLPYEQVAAHLGVTPAAARKRWERLRLELQHSPATALLDAP